ncbi:hypothetical protein M513_04453 [Trichuris suis]|uniref:RNA-directed DNA polymerase n=1 Tax=Trichuris suis TaxID=68888 RepID=A0A085MC07_9BILA|nr:hypothetical protein M513_04453 [Trichuris suis]
MFAVCKYIHHRHYIVPPRLSRRSVFSLCGKLVGHLPVCGWLRVVTALIKRRVNDATSTWDQAIEDDELRMLLQEVVSEARSRDPARGMWDVTGDEARVWVDASSLAIGVALEVDGAIVEDASWLRSDEASHINMAELDAVVKGLNLAISWRMSKIQLVTDSSTVHRWITDGLSGKTRLRTKASSEMLIRRRIGIVLSLVQEYSLDLSVKLVKSAENKADVLTRVPQRWSRILGTPTPVCATAIDEEVESRIAEIHHNSGHPGVRRTLYFVRKVCPSVSRRQVRQVIVGCEACQSIDPAPVKWRRGSLSVEKVWQRVGMDIAHYGGRPYLSLIDCGPSRFAIWRPLRWHTSADVVEQLESVFCERGAPEELLTDNDTAFRSKAFSRFAARWGIRVRFRCAHVPSGNGIVERCHRTVKVIAARKGCSIAEAAYLYNVMPRDGTASPSSPADLVYRYPVRVRGVDPPAVYSPTEDNPYAVGDSVWVKSPGTRCDARYHRGTVTGTVSSQAAEVDGVPRHVRDIRRRDVSVKSTSSDSLGSRQEDPMILRFRAQTQPEAPTESSGEALEGRPTLRRSARIRRRRAYTCCDGASGGSVPE